MCTLIPSKCVHYIHTATSHDIMSANNITQHSNNRSIPLYL